MKYKLYNYINIFIIFFSFANAFSQEANTSLKTKMLIKEYSSSQKAKTSISDSSEENKNTVIVTIMVSDDFQRSSLNDLNAFVESDFGTFLNISIPLKNLQALTALKNIEYIRAGMPVRAKLDVAVPMIFADSVKTGTSLEQAYTGEGVVVGIVDTGLDFTHPNFLVPEGNDLKISKAWIQSERGINHPSGFSYGVEYKGITSLLTKEYSNKDESHGTHVTGIVCGNGYNTHYVGVAPDAEIIFVEMGETDAQICDAIRYIFNYAKSVNKAAVVNLSLGSHYGPHDGNSFIDQSFDKLVGEGKIIVGAAGNEGNSNMHLRHSFTSSYDTLRTIINIDPYDNSKNESYVDIWGDANSTIRFGIEVYDLLSKKIVNTTNLGSTYSAFSLDKSWIMNENDTIQIQLSSLSKYPLNNKPNIEVYVKNNNYNQYGVAIVLLGSAEKRVDLWNSGIGYGANLDKLANAHTGGWSGGDSNYTIGEVGGTGNNVISVGAYNSKKTWTNLDGNNSSIGGEIGNIAAWSSKGPTADGRTKPDITAPGAILASSVNSFDAKFLPNGDYWNNVIFKDNEDINHPYYFAILQGTSMSTPLVTGAIALMLQKNPKLTPDDIKFLLQNYSNQDEMTGFIGENGSNSWGWGKLDVLKIMKSKDVEEKPKLSDVIVYYDIPSKEIRMKTELNIDKIELYNILGEKVIERRNLTEKLVNVSSLQNGIYFIKIYSGNETVKNKLLIF